MGKGIMSDNISIVAQPRTVSGKKVKQLRREGIIPAVIYGQQEPVSIQLEQKALRRALRHAGSSTLIDINLGSDTRTVLVRDIQQHVTRGDVLHVDFMEVNMREKLTAEAELVPVGEAPVLETGLGTLMFPIRVVEIECRPGDLVSEIKFDISGMDSLDSVIYMRDVDAPKGIDILSDPDAVVARVETLAAEVEEEAEVEELAPDAVEVIGEDSEEEAM
ncbi:MAG: 50S ribosomal protein L25 [Candidatus Thermofonsia bacterium]|nr:MAG: 50S ribosomal protein L25 [Candidatus Thermofonsia bacterium]